jgi:hypothetical protein
MAMPPAATFRPERYSLKIVLAKGFQSRAALAFRPHASNRDGRQRLKKGYRLFWGPVLWKATSGHARWHIGAICLGASGEGISCEAEERVANEVSQQGDGIGTP